MAQSFQQFVVIITLVFLPIAVVGGRTNFNACLADVQAGLHGIGTDIGGTDNQGHPVNVSVATALTYDLCLTACGAGAEPFDWNVFSQQFSQWLLPWLALISQLPFGGNDKQDNLVSVVLTVGSPTLAAYSLILTVLNGRWIARRFAGFTYPNVANAIRILSNLQYAPLEIQTRDGLLASLVVLHQNDKWWKEFIDGIEYAHTWSISAASSIAWVVIAFLFTLIDSYTGGVTNAINANGQAVGSLWLWLLPIIIGWLWISPKCDSIRLRKAIDRANEIAYVARINRSPILVTDSDSEARAFELSIKKLDYLRDDEKCTVPIYNYARFFPWVQAVETVAEAFEAASNHYHDHDSVDPNIDWVKVGKGQKPSDVNRTGNLEQVKAYCQRILPDSPDSHISAMNVGIREDLANVQSCSPLVHRHVGRQRRGQSDDSATASWSPEDYPSALLLPLHRLPSHPIDQELATPVSQEHHWGPQCFSRIFIASILALILQWGTTGAAVAVAWFTPTQGLGCRSASYLLYASTSTVVWMLLLVSSILTHYSTECRHRGWRKVVIRSSIVLRRLGKLIAGLNTIWILAACVFQFTNFYNRCFCNSSVYSLGAKAYNVIKLESDDTSALMTAWISGVTLAVASASIYSMALIVLVNPMLPDGG